VSAPDPLLDDRYGRSRGRGRHRALLLGVGLVVAVFLCWLAWVTWVHATPRVQSQLVGYDVVDVHTATARVDVAIHTDTPVRCLVRAVSVDHTPVGELSWVATEGRNDVTVRTEREATSVELIGCTAPGQDRPR
jgi:hypothetical protein